MRLWASSNTMTLPLRLSMPNDYLVASLSMLWYEVTMTSALLTATLRAGKYPHTFSWLHLVANSSISCTFYSIWSSKSSRKSSSRCGQPLAPLSHRSWHFSFSCWAFFILLIFSWTQRPADLATSGTITKLSANLLTFFISFMNWEIWLCVLVQTMTCLSFWSLPVWNVLPFLPSPLDFSLT